MSEEVNGVLHCTAFGDLSPADICERCEECRRNNEFSDRGGYPAMLLTGSRENLAAALRQPGVAMDDVMVVNAKRFRAMEETLKKIAEFQPAEYYECGGECNTCGQIIDMVKEALEVSDEN